MPVYLHGSRRTFLLAGAMLFAIAPAVAADVTPARLANPEPGNWLMNHRTYDAQRYSPLDRINKSNIKSLKLAYAPGRRKRRWPTAARRYGEILW
jgi:glucose dehydrogenase